MNMLKKAATDAATSAVSVAIEKATPPPPKVWCVTLRRTPPLTDEDQPPVGECERVCKKILLMPPAAILYTLGWAIYTILNFIACVLAPVIGPAALKELAARRLALQKEKGNKAAAAQAINDAKQVAGCASCLVSLMWCTYTEMITPFNLLWAWK